MDNAKKLITAFDTANKFVPHIHARYILTAMDKHGQIITYDTDSYDFWTCRYNDWKRQNPNIDDIQQDYIRHFAYDKSLSFNRQ